MTDTEAHPYRILVTGSRDWDDIPALRGALNQAIAEVQPWSQPVVIVHGACPRGADAQADQWAKEAADSPMYTVTVERHPANWRPAGQLDRAAGFRRNAEMVNLGADVCLAFIRGGSRGASHTARLAEEAGIETRRFTA